MTKFLNSTYNSENRELTMRSTKKKTRHNQVQTSLRSILTSHMKVTKIAQKHIL